MLLSVNKVRKLFGIDIILEDVSFRLERHEKVALVGRNGAGKTTLLKLLTHHYLPDGGSIQFEKGARVGYLSQSVLPDSEQSVLEVATEARQHIVDLDKRLKELEVLMAESANSELLDEYSLLQEHFLMQGGYSIESDLKVVLGKLGFEEEEFSKPISALSGGERTRLSLAKLLLEEPDLLILDEPTNHLDMDAIEWLEAWIRGYQGAVLLVSHDRTFLNAVSQKTLELRFGMMRSFPGGYDRYVVLAEEEDDRIRDLAEKQGEQMAKMDEFVRRFMNSQRTAQARGRLKHLEKLKANAVIVPDKQKGINASFKAKTRTGDIVLDCKGVSKSFGEQKLFSNLNWQVRWGEKWGVIGVNGAGKSTLIRIALGEMDLDSGFIKMGANVRLGYFNQDASFENLKVSALEVVCGRTGLEMGPARSLLGRFLISGDDALRRLSTFSGGERVKIALACLMGQEPNVLVLDEPTNHLDIDSREALAEVLQEFNGTLIMISHDRWMLDMVTHHTLDLRHDESPSYEGCYTEYRKWRNSRQSKVPANPNAGLSVAYATQGSSATATLLSPRELSKEIGRLTKLVETTESDVTSYEEKKASIEKSMATETNPAKLVELSHKFAEVQRATESSFNKWSKYSEQLDQLRSQQGIK